MKRQKYLWLAVAVTLIGSLLAVPVVTGAQEPLTESFTWAAYGLTLRHPAGWTINETATRVSLHPADRDVRVEAGPEMVLFVQPDTTADQMDDALAALVSNLQGFTGSVTPGDVAGYASRSLIFNQDSPAAQGSLTLFAVDASTVLGVAYIYPVRETAVYLSTLREMQASVTTLAAAPTPAALTFTSATVASVQLPQVVAWDALTFAFPARWQVDQVAEDEIRAMPAQSAGDDTDFRSISVSHLDRTGSIDLRAALGDVLRDGSDPTTAIADVTVNGWVGVTADLVDRADSPALAVRVLLLDVRENNALMLVVFTAAENDWPAFQPVASAFAQGIMVDATARSQAAPADAGISLVAARVPLGAPLPRQDDPPQVVTWDEMGIAFELPAGWQSFPATQEYDFALVSPEAAEGGTGAFMTFSALAYLGQTFEDAMQPLAEQAGGTVEAYAVAGLEGVQVIANEAGNQRFLILLPYGEDGESLYIQAVVPPSGDPTVTNAILDSMTITPLLVDADAINAAWQASLAANGTLVYGADDAPLKVAEYLSFTCGHCASYTTEISRLIALEVEGADRVRFELAPVMWDEYANRASRSLYCAVEQGQGYTAYKALFHGYFADGYDVAYTEDGITAIMTGLGLDMDTYSTCVEEDKYASVITAVETRFRDGGMTGTPTLTFGMGSDEPAPLVTPDGQLWSGRIPLGTVRELIALMVDDGVAPQDVLKQ